MKRTLLLLGFSLVLGRPQAQQNNTENLGFNPPGVKWRQIAAPTGPIIYPEGLDSLATRIAGIMHYQRGHDADLVGSGKTKRVPVVLQHLPVFPEGFSTPAPWRNEYFIIPPQNLFAGPTPWTDLLTVHEYRHTQQFHMANGGFTWLLKPLTGQTGWLLNTLFNQPLWFREGDAVVAETRFTKGGRGRQPRFHMETKAVLLSGYRFDYEKASYGISLRNYVPNPYRYGYYMTARLRAALGDTIWQRVLHDTYHRGLVYSFNRSLKRASGYSSRQLYEATMRELDSAWRSAERPRELTPSTPLTEAVRNNYINYRFPHFLPDGSLIALKDAFDQTRTFTLLRPGGKERPLFPYGVYSEDHLMFAAEGQLVAWAEAASHPRWGNQTYSVIKVHNLQSGETRKLTRRSRYFAPAPSHDGLRIAAIKVDVRNKASLVVLNSTDGRAIKEIAVPADAFIAQPRWMDNDREVVVVSVTPTGNSLLSINTETGQRKQLVAETTVPLSRPCPKEGYLYFSAGPGGTDNIYALELHSGKLYQVTSVRFGACEPAVSADGQTIVYSSYTAEGYQLEQVPKTPGAWKEVVLPPSAGSHHPYAGAIKAEDLTDKQLAQTYPSKRFRALTSGLFNVYGWFPYAGDDQYGVEFLTQNIMNTLRGSITPFYNTNEHALGVRFDVNYAALFPVIHLGGGYQAKRADDLVDKTTPLVYQQSWREKRLAAGLALPLILTGGNYRTELTLGADYERYDIDFLDSLNEAHKFRSQEFDAVYAQLQFSRLAQRARRQLQPRWGQELTLSHRKAVGELPEQTIARGRLYFPGVQRPHSFNLEARYKKEAVVDVYRFTGVFPMPRGYDSEPFEELYVAGANYEMPLWYPDISLGGVAFLQQLKTNLFYDYSRGERLGREYNLSSAGLELMLDLRLLRLFSMTMGLRYSQVSEKDRVATTPFQFVVTRFELQN